MSDAQKPAPRLPPEHIRRMLAAMPQRDAGVRDALNEPADGASDGPAADPAGGPSAADGSDSAAAGPPAGPDAQTRAQAAALHQQAIAEIQAGQMDAAQAHLEEGLALERGIAVPADLAATLIMLAQVRFSQNDREPALALARESLAIFQGLDAAETAQVQEIVTQMEALLRMDASGGSRDLLRQGIAALQGGDGELAGELLDASLQAAAAAGDGAVAAGALHHLGLLLFSAGHLEPADAALRDSVELNRALGDEAALAAGLALLGQVVVARGDRAAGLRVLRESVLTWNAAGLTEQAAQTKALIAEFKAEEASGGPLPA